MTFCESIISWLGGKACFSLHAFYIICAVATSTSATSSQGVTPAAGDHPAYHWETIHTGQDLATRPLPAVGFNRLVSVEHAALARTRHVFRLRFAQAVYRENAQLVFYLDVDNDHSTGRGEGNGTDVQLAWTSQPGQPETVELITCDASHRSTGGQKPLSFEIQGDQIVFTIDAPLAEKDGSLVFGLEVLIQKFGQDGKISHHERLERHTVTRTADIPESPVLFQRPVNELSPERLKELGAVVQSPNWSLLYSNNDDSPLPTPEFNRFRAVWHCPLAKGRHLFRFQFAREFHQKDQSFLAYLDTDANEKTGRQNGSGTECQIAFIDVDGTRQFYAARYSPVGAVTRTRAIPFSLFEGDSVYAVLDLDLKQKDGASQWAFSLLSQEYEAGQVVHFQRVERTLVESEAEPTTPPEQALIDVRLVSNEPPAIRDFREKISQDTSSPGRCDVTVAFRTNLIAPAVIEYGTSLEMGKEMRSVWSALVHRFDLKGLSQEETLYYRVRCLTPDLSWLASDIRSVALRIPAAPEPAIARRSVPLRFLSGGMDDKQDRFIQAGMPFPRGDLFSTEPIRLVDGAGREIASEWETMSLWPDGSVRWARCSAVMPGDLDAVAMEYGGEIHRESKGNVAVREDEGGFQVDTGELRFRIERAPFKPFSQVERKEHSNWRRLPVTGLENVATGADGTRFSSIDGLESLTVEQSSPLHAVIRARGRNTGGNDESLLAWDMRFFVWNDSRQVRVEHVLGVDDTSTTVTRFRSLNLKLHVDDAAASTLGDTLPHSLQGGEKLRVFQWLDDQCRIERGEGTPAEAMEQAAGWIRRGPLAVSVPDFWQNYPKSLGWEDDALVIGIAPELDPDQYDAFADREYVLFFPFTGGNYRRPAGFERRHEIIFDFGDGDGDGAPAARGMNESPRLVAEPAWYARTKAYGNIRAMEEMPEAILDRAFPWAQTALEQYQAERVDQGLYGFFHYGDWFGERTWDWGNLEYDLPHTLLSHFAVTGKEVYLHEGVLGAQHLMDVDVRHFDADPLEVGGMYMHCMGHTGGWYANSEAESGGRFPGGLPYSSTRQYGHYWAEGLAEYYWLTGDERAREVLLEIAHHIATYYLNERGRFFPNPRHHGWTGKALLAAYKVTGDPYYMMAIATLFENIRENQTPDGGWERLMTDRSHSPIADSRGNVSFVAAVLMSTLARYHEITADPEVEASLLDATRWFVEHFWVDEGSAGIRYSSAPAYQTGKGWFYHSYYPLAYAYGLTGDRTYADVVLDATWKFLDELDLGAPAFGKEIGMHMREMPFTLAEIPNMLAEASFSAQGDGKQTYWIKALEDGPLPLLVMATAEGQLAAALRVKNIEGDIVLERETGGENRAAEWLDLPASQGHLYKLEIEPEAGDAGRWDVEILRARLVLELADGLCIGEGVRHPRYRFLAPEAGSFTVRVRSVAAGPRRVRVLNPDGVTVRELRWMEDGAAGWREATVEVPAFASEVIGTGNRLPLNQSDRQWSVLLDGVAYEIQLEGASPYVSPSAVSVFDPKAPQLLIQGGSVVHAGEDALLLDASVSISPGDPVKKFTWDLGEPGVIEGSAIQPRFVDGGLNKIKVTLHTGQGRTDTKTLEVSTPPAIVMDADPADRIIINAPDYTEPARSSLVLTERVHSLGKILTYWTGDPIRIRWPFRVEKPGHYQVIVKYACADSHALRAFWIDDAQPHPALGSQRFESTGGWSSSEDNWAFRTLSDEAGKPIEIALDPGAHSLGALNLEMGLAVDYFVLIRVR